MEEKKEEEVCFVFGATVFSFSESRCSACIALSNLGFSSGVLEFTVVNAGEASVLVGVTDAAPESFDLTDATKNRQRYVCSFFNGKVFGPDISFSFLEACSEIAGE